MAAVTWIRCSGGVWCGLERLNLDRVVGAGVYVIWAENVWVYVGQGVIADRLQEHRTNTTILGYRTAGELLVTWATVPSQQMDGIERYVGDTLRPAVGGLPPRSPNPSELTRPVAAK